VGKSNLQFGKIISFKNISAQRRKWRAQGKRIVVTNGCFDLLHVGHLRYLTRARKLGDILWLGLNDDAGVRGLKGPGRPVHPAKERAELLSALRIVDAVTIFAGTKATRFLNAVQPDIYVKGGDYTVKTLDAEEREVLKKAKSRIAILPLVPGRSTSAALKKLKRR
jgi:rfaE bifunctional protein nucleotidyltransferase chain/domain